MKTVFLSTVVMAVVILASCAKEAGAPSSPSPDTSNQSKSISVYDQVAISHNLAMDFVGNHPRFNDLTKKQRYEYIQGYSDEHYRFTNDTDWVAHNDRMRWGIEIANSPDSASIILIREGLIDASVAGLVDSLFVIFHDAGDWDNETYMSVGDFKSRIAALESHINTNYTPVFDAVGDTANAPGMMLAACAVAKGSYEYWRDAATDSSHLWNNYTDGNIPKGLFGNIWHGIKVGAVDTGVFVGSFFGGCNNGTTNVPGGNLTTTGRIGCMWQRAGEASSGV